MSNQQIVLLVVVSTLAFAAIPGLIMGVPEPVKPPASSVPDKQESTPEPVDQSAGEHLVNPPSSIPRTEIRLEKADQETREEILFSRKVNINEASLEELQQVPGVGEATAGRIVKFREEGNQFFRVEDLTKIKLIGQRTLDNLRPHVTVGKEYERQQRPESGTDKIDINTADASTLEGIPGVGPATADRIIRYREQYGSFRIPSDLKNVSRIGGKTYERMKDHIQASAVSGVRSSPRSTTSSTFSGGDRVNINTASSAELETLPGVGPATAGNIIDYREAHGSFSSVDELDNVSGIGPATLDKISPQATVN